jgi:hypothetical protein
MPHATIYFHRTPSESAWVVGVRGGTTARWEKTDTFAQAVEVCRRMWKRAEEEDQNTFELMLMAFQGRLPETERN